jgi:hypothetical protein
MQMIFLKVCINNSIILLEPRREEARSECVMDTDGQTRKEVVPITARNLNQEEKKEASASWAGVPAYEQGSLICECT